MVAQTGQVLGGRRTSLRRVTSNLVFEFGELRSNQFSVQNFVRFVHQSLYLTPFSDAHGLRRFLSLSNARGVHLVICAVDGGSCWTDFKICSGATATLVLGLGRVCSAT